VWLRKVLLWDGVLPLCIAAAPLAVDALTGRRGAVEFVSVLLPIVAFLIRWAVGYSTIGSNNCGPVTRFLQYLLFFVGLVALILVDTFLMLAYLMPKGALFATTVDVIVMATLISIYLFTMIFAMYPGQAAAPSIPNIAAGASQGSRFGRL